MSYTSADLSYEYREVAKPPVSSEARMSKVA